MKRKRLKDSGITLIALVITIIVLLILASISIATLTGENGLITKANEAKQATIIAHEKEAIDLAYIACEQNGGVTKDNMQSELTRNGEKVNVTNSGNNLIVTFTETEHEYTVLPTGEVKEGKIEGEESNNTETIVKMIGVDETPINGGTISIYSDEGCSVSVIDNLLIQNLEGERIELEPGTYYVKIVAVPVGYKEISDVLEFKVETNQNNTWKIQLSKADELPGGNEEWEISIKNNESKGDGAITIIARDSDLILEGMEFELYQLTDSSYQMEGIEFEDYRDMLGIPDPITGASSLQPFAQSLWDLAIEDRIAPLASGRVGQDGVCKFENLETAIYLLGSNEYYVNGQSYLKHPIVVEIANSK